MSYVAFVPDNLCEWFSDMNEFSECSFCTQFPVGSKTMPLEKPIVVFGAESLKVLDNTTDETGEVFTDDRIAENKFVVGIHVPKNMGGSKCHALFDSLIKKLLFETALVIHDISTESVEYIRNTDSLFLKAYFTIDETFRRSDSVVEELKL